MVLDFNCSLWNYSLRNQQSCSFSRLQNSQLEGFQKPMRFIKPPFRKFIGKPHLVSLNPEVVVSALVFFFFFSLPYLHNSLPAALFRLIRLTIWELLPFNFHARLYLHTYSVIKMVLASVLVQQ